MIQAIYPSSAASADLQSISDPADGMNGMDGVQETLRALQKHDEHLPLNAKEQDVNDWHGFACKSTLVWVRRNNIELYPLWARSRAVRRTLLILEINDMMGSCRQETIWQILDRVHAKLAGEKLDAFANWDSLRRRFGQHGKIGSFSSEQPAGSC